MTPLPPRHWIPTALHEALLRAALLEGDLARVAYRAWRDGTDLEGPVAEDTFRLLPLLHGNLTRLGLSDDFGPRLRGIHRHAWADSQRALAVLEDVLVAFAGRGVDIVVLKGAALGPRFYRQPGERPVKDLDLLVRPRDSRRALGVLEDLGFAPDRPLPREVWPPSAGTDSLDAYPLGHGWSFHHPSDRRARGLGLDLHWFAIPQCMWPAADDGFRARAVPFSVGRATAWTLAPEDHFLHALAHGVIWNHVAPVRWAADATLIARTPGFSWSRVAAETLARGLSPPIRETAAWLAEHLDVEVPEAFFAALAGRDRWRDQWRYVYVLHPWSQRETLAHAAFDCFRYLEGRRLDVAPAIVRRYLAYRWGTSRPALVAARVLVKRLSG